jgi:hypothetical protein
MKLLPTQPAHPRDPHALRENLDHDILQRTLLAGDIEWRWLVWYWGCGIRRLKGRRRRYRRTTQLNVYDRRGGLRRGGLDLFDAVERVLDSAHFLLKGAHYGLRAPQDVDALGGEDHEQHSDRETDERPAARLLIQFILTKNR